jgi:hypothetical protein
MKLKGFLAILFVTLPILNLYAQSEVDGNTYHKLDSIVAIGLNYKIEYQYDESGYNSEYLYYTWSNTKMGYELNHKKVFVYNQDGLKTEESYLTWDVGDQWKLFNKFTMSYDHNNQLLLKNSYRWNETGNKWDLTVKQDFSNTYNADNLLSSTIVYVTNSSGNSREKYDYVYNENKYLIESMQSKWNDGSWQNFWHEILKYDTNMNVANIKLREYNNTLGWTTRTSYDYSYNTDYPLNKLYLPNNFINTSNLLPTGMKLNHVVSIITDDTKSFEIRYYYSVVITTKTNIVNQPMVTVFPNPANNFLNIKLDKPSQPVKIEILNMKGEFIYNNQISENTIIPLHGFTKGIHIIRISNQKDNSVILNEKILIN